MRLFCIYRIMRKIGSNKKAGEGLSSWRLQLGTSQPDSYLDVLRSACFQVGPVVGSGGGQVKPGH